MKLLNVHYRGWGLNVPYGRLADDGTTTTFEFTDEARQRGIELSPYAFPLKTTRTISRSSRTPQSLPGFINDALPDGWGLLLMDIALRSRGLRDAEIKALDRLAIIGETAFGALSFHPADAPMSGKDVDIVAIAKAVKEIHQGQLPELLPKLCALASPQGARPKAAVWYEPSQNVMSTGPFPDATPWLVKFPARSEPDDVCFIEGAYAELARMCTIEMPATHAFPLPVDGMSAFAVKRFDRQDGMRIPIQSFAAMLDKDFTQTTLDYEQLLALVKRVTCDHRQVERLYMQCVFNVVFNNRDDHLKNFAFILDQRGRWLLSPAFDLTFSEGPRNQHFSAVNGKGSEITRADLLAIAKSANISHDFAAEAIRLTIDVATRWRQIARSKPIPRERVEEIDQQIKNNAGLCSLMPPRVRAERSTTPDSGTFTPP